MACLHGYACCMWYTGVWPWASCRNQSRIWSVFFWSLLYCLDTGSLLNWSSLLASHSFGIHLSATQCWDYVESVSLPSNADIIWEPSLCYPLSRAYGILLSLPPNAEIMWDPSLSATQCWDYMGSISAIQCWDYKHTKPCPAFYLGVGELNTSTQTGKASTFSHWGISLTPNRWNFKDCVTRWDCQERRR